MSTEKIHDESGVVIESEGHQTGGDLIRFSINGTTHDIVQDDPYGMIELVRGINVLIANLARARAALILRESQTQRGTS